ncbi:hypothetical protein [Nannocystis punicea]|uniref:Calcineurin-like phosphoesterase n=1 Tax=Nannocystis punicea TaxID=2995304 RepID=A0ABY7HHF7_9BACT|nr:hypothetical protein [Nannocystis poenicansa]WAS98744.1 hypothetical protein O0S08_21645 [Nannocystis poenicansa]
MTDLPTARDLHAPADMVRWYAPVQLMQTAGRVAVSTALGDQLDRRILRPTPTHELTDFAHRDQLVLDFVSDSGDGWNPTYAVAYWATRPILRVQGPHGRAYELPRASVLVFGGDQVYPTPSRAAYEQRLVLPYECAFEHSEPPHPVLFAVPGNHDWYDSLATFTKLFLDKQWFCGWQVHQRASYFAARLPHDWWLVGVDVQLGSDIDANQVEYFRALAERMGPAAKIILCTAEPHWVRAHEQRDRTARARRVRDGNLAFLERLFGQRIRVFLSGDLHHYRRHATADGRIQKITAGGGGAFLHPTHVLHDDPLAGGYGLRCAFPDAATSRRLAWRNLAFPLYNPSFGAVTGLLYLLIGWNMHAALGGPPAAEFLPALSDMLCATLRSPWASLWLLVTAGALVWFADARRPHLRALAGLSHAVGHALAVLVLAWLGGQLGRAFALEWDSAGELGLSLGLLLGLGWPLSAAIFGLYLLVAVNVFGRHGNEAFSSLRIQDFKHFLRLHIRRDGALVVYPIALRRVPRRWRTMVGADRSEPKLLPDDPHPDARPRLIEAPIVLGPG